MAGIVRRPSSNVISSGWAGRPEIDLQKLPKRDARSGAAGFVYLLLGPQCANTGVPGYARFWFGAIGATKEASLGTIKSVTG